MAAYAFDSLAGSSGATLVSPGVVSFAPGANRFAYLRAGAPIRPRGAYSSTITVAFSGTYVGFMSAGTSASNNWVLDDDASSMGAGFDGQPYVFPPAGIPQTITWVHVRGTIFALIYAPVGGGTVTIGPATELPAIIEGQPGTIPLPPTPPTITKLIPASSPDTGGTLVDIIGTDLTGATAVDFGGTAGIGLTVDPSGGLATVTSPAHPAGPYPVTITTPAGTSNAATFLFTPPGAPTLTGIDPTEGPETGGTTALLTGTNLTGTTGVDFGGSPATIITTTATALLVSTPDHAAGTVDVTATDGATTTDPLSFEYVPVVEPTYGPDVIANLVALLTSELGVPVSSRRSPTATKDSDPSVVVRRTGGPSKGVASDNPTVTIEAWAPTTTESFQLLQSARMVVIEAAEQGRAGLRRYDEFAGPADLPDPSTTNPRHTLTASVVTRIE